MDRSFEDTAARIRWHRNLLKLNQAEYAAKAGIKRTQLANWESGNFQVGINGARALRKTYGLSLDFIYEGIEDALDLTLRSALIDNPISK